MMTEHRALSFISYFTGKIEPFYCLVISTPIKIVETTNVFLLCLKIGIWLNTCQKYAITYDNIKNKTKQIITNQYYCIIRIHYEPCILFNRWLFKF